jgi:ribosomal protein S1
LRSILWEIVDGEGPIIAKYLCERVARLHGFHRTGSEIKRTILAALKRTRAQSHGEGEDAVIWPKDMVASEWVEFREGEYPPGSVQSANITSVNEFGLFVEFGLSAIGFLSKKKVGYQWGDIRREVEEGDVIDVEVVRYNHEHKKFEVKLPPQGNH